MKKMEEYSEEIFKCSKCGLCQAVCPIYKLTKNECVVSRGRFVILGGILDNKLPLNTSVIKNMDLCLNCNACKDFCPSGIDAKTIFSAVKNKYNKNNLFGHFVHSKMVFEFGMNIVNFLTTLYRTLFIDRVIDKFKKSIVKTGILGKRIILANSLLLVHVKEKKTRDVTLKKLGKVVFFEGCFNRYVNPSSANATKNLLNEMGYEIIPFKQNCCAVHSFYGGYHKEFEESAVEILNSIPQEADYIVCDCASCMSVLKSYDELIEHDKKIADKVINIVDLLEKNNYKKEFINDRSFTYHKPCHAENIPFKLLNESTNAKYIELEKMDSCCGFSGEFALKYQKLSREISLLKANDISGTKADYVVTSCPACVIGLHQGLLEKGEFKRVLNLAEFLNLD